MIKLKLELNLLGLKPSFVDMTATTHPSCNAKYGEPSYACSLQQNYVKVATYFVDLHRVFKRALAFSGNHPITNRDCTMVHDYSRRIPDHHRLSR